MKFFKTNSVPLLFAIVGLVLLTVSLTKVGLYYDELHQATASFVYKGAHSPFFNFSFLGIPIMNMPYSAAIKSHIYGFYLFAFHQNFSVISWRLVGILLVTVASLAFGLLVRKQINSLALLVFYLLFITDTSVLYMVRYDWGPVALALSLRLLFVGVWLQGYNKPHVGRMNTLLLGLIVGVSVFEKLSSVVLVPVLLFMLLAERSRRNPVHWGAAFVGGFIGGLPLILANVYSYLSRGIFLSVQNVDDSKLNYFYELPKYIYSYLSLGSGSGAKKFISGVSTSSAAVNLEMIFMSVLLLLTLVLNVVSHQNGKSNKYSIVSLAIYFLVAICIFLLPQQTWIHHWIIGTPFQYLAMALILEKILTENKSSKGESFGWYSRTYLLVMLAFTLFRFYTLYQSESVLISGNTSKKWSVEYTQMAEFAAQQPNNVLFLAADWGVATQIYCMGNGTTKVVETFWDKSFLETDRLQKIIEKDSIQTVHIVFHDKPTLLAKENPEQIMQFLMHRLGWIENKGIDLPDMKLLRIYTFVKTEN